MKFIADFHFHSKYSRATSKKADLDSFNYWAKRKGIKVLGTSDFTHSEWLKNLKQRLEPAEPGLFQLKEENGKEINLGEEKTKFVLATEISCIYSKRNKTRKIHIIVFAPDFKTVEKINTQLGWIGNLKADGRPILGMDAKELAKIVLDASEDCLVVGAHCMTPWFAIFGSKSGFDSIEECFEEYSKHIYAIETGLSADPKMLWRIPDGRRVTLISSSDAHSAHKLGREANIFEGEELSYKNIINAIKLGSKADEKAPLRLTSTIEFYPQEGKYHYDGHRKCEVRLSPKESKKYNNVCPVCGKPLTIGVMNRVEELADREEGFKPKDAIPFKSLIPLEEVIAESVGQNPGTKAVLEEYDSLIKKFGSEFKVLLEVDKQDLEAAAGPRTAEAIIRVRNENVNIKPGYDGTYGEISIFSKEEKEEIPGQETLF